MICELPHSVRKLTDHTQCVGRPLSANELIAMSDAVAPWFLLIAVGLTGVVGRPSLVFLFADDLEPAHSRQYVRGSCGCSVLR